MNKKRFTEENIIGILKEAESGYKVVEIYVVIPALAHRTFTHGGRNMMVSRLAS